MTFAAPTWGPTYVRCRGLFYSRVRLCIASDLARASFGRIDLMLLLATFWVVAWLVSPRTGSHLICRPAFWNSLLDEVRVGPARATICEPFSEFQFFGLLIPPPRILVGTSSRCVFVSPSLIPITVNLVLTRFGPLSPHLRHVTATFRRGYCMDLFVPLTRWVCCAFTGRG